MPNNKWTTLHKFWERFGLAVHDENTVPKNAELPYITYEVVYSGFDTIASATASIWHRSASWEYVSLMADIVSEEIEKNGLCKINDKEYLRIMRGSPFAQRMTDPDDDSVKRIILNINIEYLTKY